MQKNESEIRKEIETFVTLRFGKPDFSGADPSDSRSRYLCNLPELFILGNGYVVWNDKLKIFVALGKCVTVAEEDLFNELVEYYTMIGV